MEENKNNILCGANTLRKKNKQNYGKIFARDHSGLCPVQYLENIALQQSNLIGWF